MNVTLYIRSQFGVTVELGNRENGIEGIIHKADKLIEFSSVGNLEGINMNNLYYLTKQSINHYSITGTNYSLKYLSSNRINLTDASE
jgi:hypothetical protein